MRLILRLFFTILLPILIFVSAIIFILTTRAGAELAIKVAGQFLTGRLEIQQIEGRLLDKLWLHDVTYQSAMLTLKIKNIHLNWRPIYLLNGKLLIDHLAIDKAIITIKDHILYGELNGNLDKNWHMHYQIQVPHIEKLIPAIGGHIHLTGDIHGNFYQPEIHTNIQLNELKSIETTKDLLVKNLQGKLITKLQLGGTFNAPKITAHLNFNSDNLQLEQLGLQLNHITLTANIDDKKLNYQGSVLSGNGQLNWRGETLFNKKAVKSVIYINGEQFLASNTHNFKVYVSPDLKITNLGARAARPRSQEWYVTGTVAVPTAEIKLADFTRIVTLPPETVVIPPSGETSKKEKYAVFSDIKLLIGNQVHIEAGGLNTFIKGELQINDYPDGDTLARGDLKFSKGYYDLKGQKLTLQQSALVFTNTPVSNPHLHLQAVKTIHYAPSQQTTLQEQTFLVGVQVTGNVEDPKITLFSDPPGLWSQADILSLILFDQPANAISKNNVQLLVSAAHILTPQSAGGINQISQHIKKTFGLTELDVQSGVSQTPGGSQSTSFVVGKYLSPRLYLNYSFGIAETLNTLRLRYSLSKHWFLQTQTNSAGSGVDVLYSIGH